jgi:hypothetical protein
MQRLILLFGIVILLLTGCSSYDYPFPQADIQLDETDMIPVHRYGKALFELDTTDLQRGLKSIQGAFPVFLNADLDNPENIRQLYEYVTDTQLIAIYQKVMEVYPELDDFERNFSESFTRHNVYYPNTKTPHTYTYISDLYFENPVVKDGDTLVIAIDVYLGSDYQLYRYLGLPLYKIRCMTPENMVVDAMKAVYFTDVFRDFKSRTLLDRMIEGGKLLAYLDAVLPETHDSLKICYSGKKLIWAEANERNVWGFLVENELVYTTDYQIQTKMIQDGPFTTGFSNNSPSRLGIFIGWQIVRSYLRNNPEKKLQDILAEPDAQKILNGSRYRP